MPDRIQPESSLHAGRSNREQRRPGDNGGRARPATFDDPSPVGTVPSSNPLFAPIRFELAGTQYWQPGARGRRAPRPLDRSNDEIVRAWPRPGDWAPFSSPTSRRTGPPSPLTSSYWYPDNGPTVLLYLNSARKPFDARTCAGFDCPGPASPQPVSEMNACAPPADATGLAESQQRWKDATSRRAWNAPPWTWKRRKSSMRRLAPGRRRPAWSAGGSALRLHLTRAWRTDWRRPREICARPGRDRPFRGERKDPRLNAWGRSAAARGSDPMASQPWTPPYELYRGQMAASGASGRRARGRQLPPLRDPEG